MKAHPCSARSFGAAILTFAILAVLSPADCRATFSIDAVDSYNRQVGSAGASCISGAIILSDVHPGVGVVHTQAYWNGTNQAYARSLMDRGIAPQAIIDSLVAHDAQHNPSIRQYGIVDLFGGGRSAAYTGSGCSDWKGHITGANYSIQGNILLGPQIVQNMETRFNATLGSLADKLMAALQAAKVPGADTRCTQYGKSTISAFLRVANPGDPTNDLYIDLNVNNTPPSQDPIDLLQVLYDDWRMQAASVDGNGPAPERRGFITSAPNPFAGATVIRYRVPVEGRTTLRVLDTSGREVGRLVDAVQAPGLYAIGWEPDRALPDGVYFCSLQTGRGIQTRRLLLLQSE